MKLFCLAQIPPLESLQKRVRAILSLPPESRSNQDHNIMLHYSRNFQYFREMQSRKGTTKLILASSCLKIVTVEKSGQTAQLSFDLKVGVVFNGTLTVVEDEHKKKFTQGQQIRDNDFEFSSNLYSRDGCEVVVLTKSDYKEVMNFEWKPLKEKIDILTKFEDFKHIKYEHMQYLAQFTFFQSYEFKQIVYEAGADPQYWYGIIRGEFVFNKKMLTLQTQQPRYSNKPKNMSIGIVQAGQSFGEQQVLLKCPRKVSVICMSNDNQLVKIAGEYFEMVYREYPRKSMELTRSLEIRDSWKSNFSMRVQDTIKNYGKLTRRIGQREPQVLHLPTLKEVRSVENEQRTERPSYNIPSHIFSHKNQRNQHAVTFREKTETDNDVASETTFGLTEVFAPKGVHHSVPNQKVRQNSQEKAELQQLSQYSSISRNINQKYQIFNEQIVKKRPPMPPRISFPKSLPRSELGRGLIDADSYIKQKQMLLSRMRDIPVDQERQLIPIELDRIQKLKVMQVLPRRRQQNKQHQVSKSKLVNLMKERAMQRLVMGSPQRKEKRETMMKAREEVRPESMIETNKFDQMFFRKM